MKLPVIGFEIPIEIVTLGVITGMTYGLLGVGLTLLYRTSRVLNFAHGEIGALPAILVAVLVLNHGWSWWVAVPAGLAMSAAMGAVTEWVVIRRLANAPRLIVLVATIGVAQVLFVCNALVPRTGRLGGSPYPTPFTAHVTIGNLRLNAGHLVILVAAPVIVFALHLFLQRTSLGMASRAAAENREAALLAGVPIARVSLVVWVIASVLAGASAILVGPTRPILTQVALGPSLMVRALAAALIGGLERIPYVLAGGIAIGVVELLVAWNYPTGGLLEMTLFVIVVATLFLRHDLGQRARGSEESSWSLSGTLRPIPRAVAALASIRRARTAGLAMAALGAVALPLALDNSQRVLASSVVLFALTGLSLVVVTGFAGQVSLGQFAFVLLGALVGGRMAQLGYPPWVGVVYATGAAGITALVIGVSALRIRGLLLAVVTLGFALAASTWLFGQPWLVVSEAATGGTSLRIPRPELWGINFHHELNYYWLCLALFCGVAAGVNHLRGTGLGRSMMAVRDNERAAAALSVSPRRAKLAAFVLGGMIAGLAGYFYGGLLVSIDPRGFGPEQSLNVVAMAVFGGVTTITGVVLGALWVRGIPYAFGTNVGLLSSGAGLLVVLLIFPGGLAAAVFRVRDRLVEALSGKRPAKSAEGDVGDRIPRARLPARIAPPSGASLNGRPLPIEARGISVRFGGIAAVHAVDLRASEGELVGVVGANGAGKTTLFDALSGQITPDAGTVLLHGLDVTRLRPEARAQLGMARSFQQARLFDEMSLRDALKVSLERREPSEALPSLLGLPPSRAAERSKDLAADDLLDLLSLGPYADRQVNELSTGMRRLAELGCIVGLGADVLLLDEPMAGIAQREVEAFVPVIREIRDHLGATLVIIDHDIPMITSLVDRAYVLAQGVVIAEGPLSAVREDPHVIAAYLGTEPRAVARSGPRHQGAAHGHR